MKKIDYWGRFPKTDEQYTKTNKQGGRTSTAITPVYMVKLATDVLGPIGIGWGYRVIEERFDNTQPIILINGDKDKGVLPVYMTDNGAIVWEKTHTVLLEMWVDDKTNTYSQYGHTKYSYMTKTGSFYVDHEYGKKSITDAMTKCLSLLGVCSDVYMGEFDDQAYKELARTEHAIEKADNKAEEIEKRTTELREHIAATIDLMGMCPNMEAMKKAYATGADKIDLLAKTLTVDPEHEKIKINQCYFELESKFKAEQGAQ